MKTAIVQFPGSNCDQDCLHVFKEVLGCDAYYVWHSETDVSGADLIVLPGGFSYGDYLRAGAIAKVSPVMASVRDFAEKGGYVIGICNGFQILLENHMLPGAMLRNKSLEFVCKDVWLKVASTKSPFTSHLKQGELLNIPIAHAEGNFFIDDDGLMALQDNGQIAFQYADSKGKITDSANPNGAINSIAGITNRKGNVLGMMPHPERAAEKVLGGKDGKRLLEGIVNYLK